MINFKNTNNIKNAKTQIRGERIDPKDKSLFFFDEKKLIEFGQDLNDNVEFSVYDLEDNLLSWRNIGIPEYDKGADSLLLKPGSDLKNSGFNRGQYRVIYTFLRNGLGSYLGNRMFIKEISPSRREIRILPVKTGNEIEDGIFSTAFAGFSENNIILREDFQEIVQQNLNEYFVGTAEDIEIIRQVQNVETEQNELFGKIILTGNEPFTQLQLELTNGETTPISDSSPVFDELRQNQLSYVKVQLGGPQPESGESPQILVTSFEIVDINTPEEIKFQEDFDIIKSTYVTIFNRYLNEFPSIIGQNASSIFLDYIVPLTLNRVLGENAKDSNPYLYRYYSQRLSRIVNTITSGLEFQDKRLKRRFLKFLMNFGDDRKFLIINWIRDNQEFPEFPYSIILKLYEPLPNDIESKSQFWISRELSPPVIEKVFLIGDEAEISREQNLRPANFNIDVDVKQGRPTPLESWNDILSTETFTSHELMNKIFSGSLENVELNIDYGDYDNFVRFGSSLERLANFKYKLELLEDFQDQIDTLQGITSSESSSEQVQADIQSFTLKRKNLLGTFDNYERWLYYESGVQYSSSAEPSGAVYFNPIGEWPKQNDERPYTIFPTTSSEAENWFATQSSIAQIYDQNNDNRLVNNAPLFLTIDSESEDYLTFLDMIGQYFDMLYTYIKHLRFINRREESIDEGLAKDLTFDVVKSFGYDLQDGNDYVELWKYALGFDVSGSLLQSGSIDSAPYEDVTKEIWRRILNNLPYLMKTKGTKRSIKALLTCYGIPSTLLTIREYGGPDPITFPEIADRSSYIFDDFVYTIDFSGGQSVTVNWQDFGSFTEKPKTLEFRFKTEYTSPETQSLVNQSSVWGVSLYRTGIQQEVDRVYRDRGKKIGDFRQGKVVFEIGGNQISSSEFPFFDGNFYSVILTTANESHSLFVKRADSGRIIYQSSSSMASGSTYENDGTLYIGGDGANFGNQFSGSIQEFKLFQPALSESVFDNHVIWPKSYNSNQVTSSFTDLVLRYSFDDPKNHNSDPTVSDVKANQTFTNAGTANGFANETNYTPVEEEFSALTPQLGYAPFVSNKIRIEDNQLPANRELHSFKRVEISAFDRAPLDSNRLGIFFSPIEAVNRDIIATFAGEDLTGFLGDFEDRYNEKYEGLEELNKFYFQKFSDSYNSNEFIRVLNHYDKSLFRQLQSLLPARTDSNIGILIEPHLLERSKVKYRPPEYERLDETASIDIENTRDTIADYFAYNTDLRISQSLDLDGEARFYTASLDSNLPATGSYLSGEQQVIEEVPPLSETVEDSGSFFNRKLNIFAFDRFTKYQGTTNTKETTIDGKEPIIITLTNPNRLKTTTEGPSKLKVE